MRETSSSGNGLEFAGRRRGTAGRRLIVGMRRRCADSSCAAAWIGAVDLAGGVRQAVGIQDHDDAAVAQDGVAGIEGVPRRIGATGLTTISSVSKTRSTTMPKVLAPTWATITKRSVGRAFGCKAQRAAQRHQRQQPVAQAQHRRCVDGFDARFRAVGNADQLDDIELRNGEALPRRFHDQRRDDRQGQRNLDQEGRAAARPPTSARWCRRCVRYWCAPRPCRRRGRKRW